MNEAIEEGTVRWYSVAKGYGFITRAATGEDVFVHYSALVDADTGPLIEGQKVRFELSSGPKGPQGRRVSRA